MAKITYGICKNLSWLALLAKEKGCFRAQGLDIDFRQFSTGRKAMLALQKGWVDVADIIDANVAHLAFEKKPKVKLLCLTQRKDDAGILLRRDADIKEPEDLPRAKLAYLSKTSSHMFLVKFCEYHGLDFEKLKLESMPPDLMKKALLRGEIDGFSLWEPVRINTRLAAAQEGVDLISFDNDCGYQFYVALGAGVKAINKKQEDIKKVMAALEMASEEVKNNKSETKKILSQNYDLSSQIFGHIIGRVDLGLRDIPLDFWEQVKKQMYWIYPEQEMGYEKILTSFKL